MYRHTRSLHRCTSTTKPCVEKKTAVLCSLRRHHPENTSRIRTLRQSALKSSNVPCNQQSTARGRQQAVQKGLPQVGVSAKRISVKGGGGKVGEKKGEKNKLFSRLCFHSALREREKRDWRRARAKSDANCLLPVLHSCEIAHCVQPIRRGVGAVVHDPPPRSAESVQLRRVVKRAAGGSVFIAR